MKRERERERRLQIGGQWTPFIFEFVDETNTPPF